jgi:hypothetical protein
MAPKGRPKKKKAFEVGAKQQPAAAQPGDQAAGADLFLRALEDPSYFKPGGFI